MDIDTVNQAYKAATDQANVAYQARLDAEAARRALADAEREAVATAQRYGAGPDKIQAVVMTETKEARAAADAAALRAEDEAHALRLLHYELDRIRTVVDLAKISGGV
jgi:hypothetical protein